MWPAEFLHSICVGGDSHQCAAPALTRHLTFLALGHWPSGCCFLCVSLSQCLCVSASFHSQLFQPLFSSGHSPPVSDAQYVLSLCDLLEFRGVHLQPGPHSSVITCCDTNSGTLCLRNSLCLVSYSSGKMGGGGDGR